MRKSLMSLVWLLSSGIGLSMNAWSDEQLEGGGFYIAPTLSYTVFDEDLSLKDDFSYGLGAGYKFSHHWAAELAYSYVDTEDENLHQDVDVGYWELSGLYYFNAIGKYKPFLIAGYGNTLYDYRFPTPLDKDIDQWVAGVGVAYALSKEVELRADFRGLISEDHAGDRAYGADFDLGFFYYFGEIGRPAKSAPVTVAPKVVEVPVVAVVEKDTDADGVLDSKDQCPDTQAKAKVTSNGCYEELKEEKDFTMHLKFEVNKAVIRNEVRDQVTALAEFLKEYPHTDVVVEGHTDNVGADLANKELSQRRADAVKQSLITDYAIEADRITSIGYGESQPIASNDSAAGQAENRRVVARITNKKD